MNTLRYLCGSVLLASAAAVVSYGQTASGDPSAEITGNAEHGKEIYEQCMGCHTLAENKIGPRHCGVVGRPAGSVPGFEYSEEMKTSGIVWDPKTLDEFLTFPIGYVNGTKMGFAGLDNPTDRADVIAYLYQVGNDPAICPKG